MLMVAKREGVGGDMLLPTFMFFCESKGANFVYGQNIELLVIKIKEELRQNKKERKISNSNAEVPLSRERIKLYPIRLCERERGGEKQFIEDVSYTFQYPQLKTPVPQFKLSIFPIIRRLTIYFLSDYRLCKRRKRRRKGIQITKGFLEKTKAIRKKKIMKELPRVLTGTDQQGELRPVLSLLLQILLL